MSNHLDEMLLCTCPMSCLLVHRLAVFYQGPAGYRPTVHFAAWIRRLELSKMLAPNTLHLLVRRLLIQYKRASSCLVC